MKHMNKTSKNIVIVSEHPARGKMVRRIINEITRATVSNTSLLEIFSCRSAAEANHRLSEQTGMLVIDYELSDRHNSWKTLDLIAQQESLNPDAKVLILTRPDDRRIDNQKGRYRYTAFGKLGNLKRRLVRDLESAFHAAFKPLQVS